METLAAGWYVAEGLLHEDYKAKEANVSSN
jgi:hypothetical protein